MKKYLKPELEVIDIKANEAYAEDPFGTGENIPVTWYTADGINSWFI